MRKTTIALIAATMMVAVPLAGCIGGSSGGNPASGPSGTKDEIENATGNRTEGEGAGNVSHVHPRWDNPETPAYDDLDKIAVIDTTITLDPTSQSCPRTSSGGGGQGGSGGRVCLGGVVITDLGNWPNGDPHIIPPGTEKVTVQLNWSSGADIAGLNVFYRDALDRPGTWSGAMPDSPVTESGGTASVVIGNKTAMADNGHAQQSAWQFSVEAYGNPSGQSETYDRVRYADGKVKVRVVAHRVNGSLPLEPPHPDYWAETSTYQLGHLTGSAGQTIVAGPFTVDQGSSNPQTNRPGLKWINNPGKVGYRFSGPRPDKIPNLDVRHPMQAVPPQTKTLAATVRAQISTQAGSPQVCVLKSTEPARQWQEAVPMGEGCKPAPSGNKTLTFRETLKAEQWDSLYAGSDNASVAVASFYTFFVYVRPQTVENQQAGATLARPAQYSVDSLEASIFVTTNSTFTFPSWGKGPVPSG